MAITIDFRYCGEDLTPHGLAKGNTCPVMCRIRKFVIFPTYILQITVVKTLSECLL